MLIFYIYSCRIYITARQRVLIFCAIYYTFVYLYIYIMEKKLESRLSNYTLMDLFRQV